MTRFSALSSGTDAPDRAIVAELPDLATPSLLLDEAKMMRNIARLRDQLAPFDVGFRPHLKTAKCHEVARRMMPAATGPAAVSTLGEAEQCASAGVTDILYAVGIAPAKLDRVAALRADGIDIAVILDSLAQADAVAARGLALGIRYPVLVEIDSDGHRSGLRPHDPLLVEVASRVHEHAELRGVMTHAGGSYDVAGAEAVAAAAEGERRMAVAAAETLRSAGLPSRVVSVGSTPTALFTRDLAGVTEVRAGNYVFLDLVMAGLGVCTVEDIALSVLATVIGHRPDKGWIIVDAGWMAMSRDRGTARQAIDQGYGVVCDLHGRPYEDLIMADANQEHGLLALRPGSTASLPALAVGTQVRVLPNHACATAAAYDHYDVIDAAGAVRAKWSRFHGW